MSVLYLLQDYATDQYMAEEYEVNIVNADIQPCMHKASQLNANLNISALLLQLDYCHGQIDPSILQNEIFKELRLAFWFLQLDLKYIKEDMSPY